MLPEIPVISRPNSGLGAPIVTDEMLDAAFMPCVTYRCAADFTASSVSSNSLELIGIRPENILGKRTLWDERRLRSEDRDRLLSRLNRLGSNEIGSLTHKIANDQGLYISVAHSFRKVSAENAYTIHGCMVPLPGEVSAETLDGAVIPQFVHKIGNHFQLIHLLIGSLKRTGTNLDEIETLQLTVDRAVEFTRAFSQYTQPPVFTPSVGLGEILRTVAESIAACCEERKIVFKQNLECLDDAVMAGDAFLLEFAFAALLQNAMDATPSGNQIVVTGKKAKKRSGLVARIAIVDSGCGMDKNMLIKAAHPFVTSKRDRDGLGLSAALRIVELHGGRLKIASVSGQGTKVEIMFPLSFAGEVSDV